MNSSQQPRTLQDELTLLSPPTPGEQVAIEVGMGLTVGFMIWMLLGAPGIGD
jgi:hypothetical protein